MGVRCYAGWRNVANEGIETFTHANIRVAESFSRAGYVVGEYESAATAIQAVGRWEDEMAETRRLEEQR